MPETLPKQIKIEAIAPQLRVHYIFADRLGQQTHPASRHRSKWPVPVIVFAIVIGLATGSYGTWASKFGQAGAGLEPTQGAQGSVLSGATTEPWIKPLEYDQSDLNVVADFLPALIEENHREPTAEELEFAKQKQQLTQYLAKWKSPFAQDEATVEAFLNSRNMKLMLAIAFVESSMGKKCYYYNCSGIGGYAPNLRQYNSYAEWITDFDDLLERRYKGLPVEDFMGLYVQPGSPNWIGGVKQILAELKEAGIE